MDWQSEITKALLSLGVALLTLGCGWIVGNRLTYGWAIRQRRREALLAATSQFYAAYGEFFVAWKLWNRLEKSDTAFAERRWQLLQKAANAESIAESILLKIVTELSLSPEEVADLGRFRQAFQSLRQAIRDDKRLDWPSSEDPHYVAFKRLSCQVACLLQSGHENIAPKADEAARNHRVATSNEWENNWF